MTRTTRLLVAALLSGAACNLDLQNPNAPTEDEVITTIDGLIAVAVGMQGQYAGAIEDYLVPNSLITDEWGTGLRSLISYQSLLTGLNFDTGYAVVEAPWSQSYRVVKSANTVLAGVEALDLGAGLEGGAAAIAKLFKGMAYGQLYLTFDQAPIDVSSTAPRPRPRAEVLDTVIALLESARSDLRGVSDADLAGFRSRIQGTGFDVRNTVHAMLARYYLFAARYQDAIDAADSVNLSVAPSVLAYPSPAENPIYDLSGDAQYVFGLKSFADSAEAGDQRVTYWLDTDSAFVGNPDSTLYELRKYGRNESYPVYLPDEMKLIQAEAYTRLAQYAPAADLVNEVRTDTVTSTGLPAAGLPALDPATQLGTEAELLAQIAYNRRYELYMQGLRWEDTRRLGTAITTTPVMTFLPIPRQECVTNPNANANPGCP